MMNNTIMYENKDELVEYVLDAKKQGMSEQQIMSDLMHAGWDAVFIENAMLNSRVKEHEESMIFHAITGITLMTLVFLLAYLV